MSKANEKLKQAADAGADVFNQIANGGAAAPAAPVNTQATKGTKNAKPGYYRFNLNMPLEYENYLKTAAYNASSPGHLVSITEYICELIRQDMNAKAAKDAKTGDE